MMTVMKKKVCIFKINFLEGCFFMRKKCVYKNFHLPYCFSPVVFDGEVVTSVT